MNHGLEGRPSPTPLQENQGSFVEEVAFQDDDPGSFSSSGLMSVERWRDLLPLPSVKVENPPSRSEVSEGRLRRSKRRSANAEKVNGIIESLNEMAGYGEFSQRRPTKAQQTAHQNLFSAVSHAPRCDIDVQPREAVYELLRTGLSCYGSEEEARSTTVRSYSKGLVSLPESGAEVFSAEELLDDIGRDILQDPHSHMFQHDVQRNSKLKPYMDEVLKQSPQTYHDFVADLYEKGMITFGKVHRATITPFFVVKKNNRLRLVLDCRQTNELFKPPPDIAMSAGYTFGQLMLDKKEEVYVAHTE
jgi:hypothetical protein